MSRENRGAAVLQDHNSIRQLKQCWTLWLEVKGCWFLSNDLLQHCNVINQGDVGRGVSTGGDVTQNGGRVVVRFGRVVGHRFPGQDSSHRALTNAQRLRCGNQKDAAARAGEVVGWRREGRCGEARCDGENARSNDATLPPRQVTAHVGFASPATLSGNNGYPATPVPHPSTESRRA